MAKQGIDHYIWSLHEEKYNILLMLQSLIPSDKEGRLIRLRNIDIALDDHAKMLGLEGAYSTKEVNRYGRRRIRTTKRCYA